MKRSPFKFKYFISLDSIVRRVILHCLSGNTVLFQSDINGQSPDQNVFRRSATDPGIYPVSGKDTVFDGSCHCPGGRSFRQV